jgi:branched-chain amino acid transport system ATP-binding protein
MLLSIRGLHKEFGGLTAIDNVSLDVEKGELLGIIGPNGAGKTTLFNLITGIIRPTKGEIIFEEKSIVNLPKHMIADRGIGRTFQTTKNFPLQTVLDNVMVGMISKASHGLCDALFRRKREEERLLLRRCKEVLRLVALEEFADVAAGQLNQEQQKRLAIGIAMATSPKVLLLDEPTGGINVDEIRNLIHIIRRIQEGGTTICLIEHKMKMIMELSERIVVFNHGKKIAEGSPHEIRGNAEVIKAYLGGSYVA